MKLTASLLNLDVNKLHVYLQLLKHDFGIIPITLSFCDHAYESKYQVNRVPKGVACGLSSITDVNYYIDRKLTGSHPQIEAVKCTCMLEEMWNISFTFYLISQKTVGVLGLVVPYCRVGMP